MARQEEEEAKTQAKCVSALDKKTYVRGLGCSFGPVKSSSLLKPDVETWSWQVRSLWHSHLFSDPKCSQSVWTALVL